MIATATNPTLWTVPGSPGRREVVWADALVAGKHAMEQVGLGLRFRGAVPGPEQALVERFLVNQVFALPRGSRLAVFAQPALPTGFPDIVAVVWRETRTRRWSDHRHALRAQDIRIIHALNALGWTELAFLSKVFPKGLEASLRRLEQAELIVRRRRKCRARPVHKTFAVEMLVSVEAKVSAQERLLEQASQNAWFSSESYALVPDGRAVDWAVRQAVGMGIGMLTHGDSGTKVVTASRRREVPASYASWLFNEWVWRMERTRRPGQRQDGVVG